VRAADTLPTKGLRRKGDPGADKSQRQYSVIIAALF